MFGVFLLFLLFLRYYTLHDYTYSITTFFASSRFSLSDATCQMSLLSFGHAYTVLESPVSTRILLLLHLSCYFCFPPALIMREIHTYVDLPEHSPLTRTISHTIISSSPSPSIPFCSVQSQHAHLTVIPIPFSSSSPSTFTIIISMPSTVPVLFAFTSPPSPCSSTHRPVARFYPSIHSFTPLRSPSCITFHTCQGFETTFCHAWWDRF